MFARAHHPMLTLALWLLMAAMAMMFFALKLGGA